MMEDLESTGFCLHRRGACKGTKERDGEVGRETRQSVTRDAQRRVIPRGGGGGVMSSAQLLLRDRLRP